MATGITSLSSSTDSDASYLTAPQVSSDGAGNASSEAGTSSSSSLHPRPSANPHRIPLPANEDIPKDFVRWNSVAYDWTKELSEHRIRNEEHPSMPLPSSKDLAVLGSTLRMKMWLPSYADPNKPKLRTRGKGGGGEKDRPGAPQLPNTKAIVDTNSPEDVAAAMSAMNNEFSRSKSPFYSEVSYLEECSGKEASLGGIEVYVAVVGRVGQKAILLPKAHVTMHVNKLYVYKKTETIIPVPRGRRGIKARLVYEDGAEGQGNEMVQSLERFVLESQQQLRKLENQVRQHNSGIKRAKDLKQWRSDYEDVRQLWLRSTSTGPVSHFLAIDTECWDQDTRDKDIIIEVGWSLVVPRTGGFQQDTTHFLVQESYEDNLRNGKYVPDNRMRFLFGDESSIDVDTAGYASPWNPCTRIAGLLELGAELSRVIEDLRERGPVYIVFHCAGGDLGVLESLQVNSTHWTFAVSGEISDRDDGVNDTDSKGHEEDAESASTSSSGIGPTMASLVQPALRTETADGRPLHAVRVIDTQALFAALQVGDNMKQIGLKNLCLILGVNESRIEATHNAANDAHYTALALAEMASGPPLEEMRERLESTLPSQLSTSKADKRQERKLEEANDPQKRIDRKEKKKKEKEERKTTGGQTKGRFQPPTTWE